MIFTNYEGVGQAFLLITIYLFIYLSPTAVIWGLFARYSFPLVFIGC